MVAAFFIIWSYLRGMNPTKAAFFIIFYNKNNNFMIILNKLNQKNIYLKKELETKVLLRHGSTISNKCHIYTFKV